VLAVARGAVVDGLIRDRRKIAELGFPVFGRGCRPTDSLGRVSIREVDTAVEFGGVEVRSGDLVAAGFKSPVGEFKDLKLDSAPLVRSATYNGNGNLGGSGSAAGDNDSC